jgi:uncharacterized membrane protein
VVALCILVLVRIMYWLVGWLVGWLVAVAEMFNTQAEILQRAVHVDFAMEEITVTTRVCVYVRMYMRVYARVYARE